MELPNGFAEHIQSMAGSPLRNYIVPGLTSLLIGGDGRGCVRMFDSAREQQSDIAPHSHRFDFVCLVLQGQVRNIVWERCTTAHTEGEQFELSEIDYGGVAGSYKKTPLERGTWRPKEYEYGKGDFYGMTYNQIHSIFFSKGAKVLFFEGPAITNASVVLDPVSDNEVIPTSDVQSWMFRKAPPDDHFA